MIYNKINDEFQYNGITYRIGTPIIGTDESEYKGLFGTITEIRTGNDKETDNTTPDIYCSFELPLLQQEINDLEARFSELYGEKKWIEDIILDEVILSPAMIKLLSSDKPSQDGLELFIVDEAWTMDGEPDSSITIFTDYDEAKYLMHENLKEDMENGIISRIGDCDKFISDEGVDFYDGYIDGEHNEDFYKIEIKRVKVDVADDKLLKLVSEIGFKYVDEYAGDRPGCFVPEQNIEKPKCLGNEDNEDCVNCDFYCNRREYLNGNPTLYALLKSYFGQFLDAETIDNFVWEAKFTYFHNDNEAERRAYADNKANSIFTSLIAKMREACKTAESVIEYFKDYKTDISPETAEKILFVLHSSNFNDITEE